MTRQRPAQIVIKRKGEDIMAYKISGETSEEVRIIVIEESGWTVEDDSLHSAGSYNITTASGKKLVAARRPTGEGTAYGNVEAEYYT